MRLLLLITLILSTFLVRAQNQFTDEIVYKRWTFHINTVLYRSGEATLKRGIYDIQTHLMRGARVGFEYIPLSKSEHGVLI